MPILIARSGGTRKGRSRTGEGTRPNPSQTFLSQMKAAGLPEPTLEVKFHPTRRWKIDLAYPSLMIAIEIEGGAARVKCGCTAKTGIPNRQCKGCRGSGVSRGRHASITGFEADCEKYNTATSMGWSVLRFTAQAINSGLALQLLIATMKTRSKEIALHRE